MKSYKAFTFFELLIVLVLISIFYAMFSTNFNVGLKEKEVKISLKQLKTFLLKNYSFNQELSFVCIEEGSDCFVFIDGKQSKLNSFTQIFESKPEVYEYNNILNQIKFDDIRFENQEEYEVCFKMTINSDRKSNEMIVVSDGKVYVYNAIYKYPIILNYLDEIHELFEKNIQKVKNAF